MKKFCITVYLLIMALFVMTMSGCGGSSGGDVPLNTNKGNSNGNNGNGNGNTQSTQSKQMIFKSTALKRDGTYSLFRGDKVGAIGTTAKYYLAPASEISRGNEEIVMNLEFSSSVSEDLPFMITESDDRTVLFYYNPAGEGKDLTSTGVLRSGGLKQKLSYSNLSFNGSSITVDDSNVIDIMLNSDGKATAGGTTIPSYDYIWHADPQHVKEYWTLSGDSTNEELKSSKYKAAIEEKGTVNGLYIAHDIRYTPNNLGFTTSNTGKKDEDTEYVVYYDSTATAVAEEIAEIASKYSAYGYTSTDKYIFATLPMSNGGMGGNPGGPGGGNNPGGPGDGNTPSDPPDRNNTGGDTRMPITPSMTASATDDSSIAAVSTMTHSATEAYNNPVLHITEPGTYRLKGTWKGQIWVEVGEEATDQVALILNGVTVECTVAPALVFYEVYPWAEDNGYDDEDTLTANNLWKTLSDYMISSDGYPDVGAIVEVVDGTTNTFTGANVYRILKLELKLNDDKTAPKCTASEMAGNIDAQKKMYKLDGAFHSRNTMIIGSESAGTGKLNITSTTCEGLDSEMHMLVDGGNITVTAVDDGINVNEDDVSVFTMNNGTLNINSENADGIDSNGWVVINGGTLNIKAGTQKINSAGEAGIDAEKGYVIANGVTYNYTQANGNGGGENTNGNTNTETDNNSGNTDNTNTNGNSNTDADTVIVENPKTLAVTVTTETVGDSEITLFPDPQNTIIEEDNEGERKINPSGTSFPLVHRVNDFGGLQ